MYWHVRTKEIAQHGRGYRLCFTFSKARSTVSCNFNCSLHYVHVGRISASFRIPAYSSDKGECKRTYTWPDKAFKKKPNLPYFKTGLWQNRNSIVSRYKPDTLQLNININKEPCVVRSKVFSERSLNGQT